MTAPPAAPRPRCPRCGRPASACICACVAEVDNHIEVLILQHPMEQHEAKGSGRLLQLCLRRSRLEVGERFELPALQARVGSMADTLLLYPVTPGEGPAAAPAAGAAPRRLIVLDATWRKSRKMLLLNPWLQTLPRLALDHPPASRYGLIRKAHRDDQLSTLEATAWALQQLERQEQRYAPLWAAFDRFVAQLTAARDAGAGLSPRRTS
ncbi:DTW domain-containing protein [Aquabacterium sp. A7-Y]|uniref:tRNA-uridine aminocarboxypropyltransferase n=1 Tax=Aquabacterium sp. A7-Y TaxID=1349605 RepID=UPI00223CF9D7|nr:tRNA-uridine aminocarboxypropyltransferase [Aquabacterium sp. A7-Y]MCW7537941.1 DTW domain-containing protein [Aquabacterium sp. A7-Y]